MATYTNQDPGFGYSLKHPPQWTTARQGKVTEIQSREGEVVLKISVREFPDKLLQHRFAEEHRASVIAVHAHSAEYFNITLLEGFQTGGYQRFRFAWRWQPDAESCVMDIVDIVFRSRYYPAKRHGYVVSVSICGEHLDAYLEDRERMLGSFEEQKPPGW